jgi:hypothetical protein
MSVTKENDIQLDGAKFIKKMATKIISLDESKFKKIKQLFKCSVALRLRTGQK